MELIMIVIAGKATPEEQIQDIVAVIEKKGFRCISPAGRIVPLSD